MLSTAKISGKIGVIIALLAIAIIMAGLSRELTRLADGVDAVLMLAIAVSGLVLGAGAGYLIARPGPVKPIAGAGADLKQLADSYLDIEARQVAAIASATLEVARAVQAVASAAEQLSASIGEISRQASNSGSVKTAETHRMMVHELADAAAEITRVVQLIDRLQGAVGRLLQDVKAA